MDESQRLDFVTLGMFIIDEVHFAPLADGVAPSRPHALDIAGGAGSYAAIGARIMSPDKAAAGIGWVVDAGHDFPPEVRQTIDSWGTSCHWRETPERLTTRGWNGYGENEYRAFRYLTPKLRLDHTSLPQHFILSRTFHLICSPARCSALVTSLLRRRATVATSLDADADQPLFIWEPVPDMCMPSELPACIEALKHVDVVSPNHAELCAFLGAQPQDAKGNVSVNQVEAGCKAWLDAGVGRDGRGAVVVRAGKDGCLVATRGTSSSDYSMRWVPAFHQRSEVDEGIGKIVDPTGGGNAFLGGLAVGLARLVGQRGHLDLVVEAALWGSVAASFAIEQIGMPTLERREHGEETWNGDSADLRVQLLKDRISSQP